MCSSFAAGLPYLVATRGNSRGQLCLCEHVSFGAGYRFTIEDSIYVEEGLDGRGIGAALLGELLRRCEAGPWRQILAVMGNNENHGSIGLHRSRGFELVGTFRDLGFKLGRWVDTVLMPRRLGPGTGCPPFSRVSRNKATARS